jgi:hypothetical protein
METCGPLSRIVRAQFATRRVSAARITEDSLIEPASLALHLSVSPGGLLERFSPYAHVATAVAPFVGAVAFRLLTGRSRLASVLISVATTWFAVLVFLTPMSSGMQQDLLRLRWLFH